MKRNGVLAASARRAASFFGFLILGLTPAVAGDRALIDFIGFSTDARYFAFEEYGVTDGAGFAYSNIFVVDLETDSWVPGTPVRLRADDEYTPLLAIRAQASSEAFSAIDQFDIAIPADLAALNGDGAPGIDGKTLVFGIPGYQAGVVMEERQLALSTFPTTAPDDCSGFFGSEPLGYELTISGGAAPVVLHRDQGALPQSRGCPLDYRLYAVVLPWYGAPQGTGVAIVSVYPGGFEGPDRRFLAVPFDF